MLVLQHVWHDFCQKSGFTTCLGSFLGDVPGWGVGGGPGDSHGSFSKCYFTMGSGWATIHVLDNVKYGCTKCLIS